jgi:hypothetical protein
VAPKRKITANVRGSLEGTERQVTSMALPVPIHFRLDELVRHAAAAKATRADIVAMLIAEAELDPDALEQRLLRYRKLTVGDVVSSPDTDDVVFPIYGPGRRKTDAAG